MTVSSFVMVNVPIVVIAVPPTFADEEVMMMRWLQDDVIGIVMSSRGCGLARNHSERDTNVDPTNTFNHSSTLASTNRRLVVTELSMRIRRTLPQQSG